MPKFSHLALFLCAVVLVTATLVLRPGSPLSPAPAAAAAYDKPILLPLAANVLTALEPANPFGLVEPVAQFRNRISKKTFGMFITPGTSPVEHDRFAGFHTGVDAEFTDITVDIPVVAVAGGTVVVSKWATGYGGVVVVRQSLQDRTVYALYGHLDPASLIPTGSNIAAGQQVGILGDDHSEQTDGVRKHLHFSFYTGEKLDIRGYVPTEEELVNWANPLDYF